MVQTFRGIEVRLLIRLKLEDYAPDDISILSRVFCVRLRGPIHFAALVELERVTAKLCYENWSSGGHPRTESPGAHIGAVCEVVELHVSIWPLSELNSQQLPEHRPQVRPFFCITENDMVILEVFLGHAAFPPSHLGVRCHGHHE